MVTIDQSGIARLWDLNLNLLAEINAAPLNKGAFDRWYKTYSVRFLKDGVHVMITGPRNMSVWDAAGNPIWNKDVDLLYHEELAVSDEYILAITCTERGRGVTIGSLRQCYNSLAQLWDFEGNIVGSLEPRTVDDDLVEFARFNTQGNRIITAHGDGLLRLWDKEGNLIIEFAGKSAAADFHPDGTNLATIRRDGILQFWEVWVDLDAMMSEAMRRAGRTLTEQECQRYLDQATCSP